MRKLSGKPRPRSENRSAVVARRVVPRRDELSRSEFPLGKSELSDPDVIVPLSPDPLLRSLPDSEIRSETSRSLVPVLRSWFEPEDPVLPDEVNRLDDPVSEPRFRSDVNELSEPESNRGSWVVKRLKFWSVGANKPALVPLSPCPKVRRPLLLFALPLILPPPLKLPPLLLLSEPEKSDEDGSSSICCKGLAAPCTSA